MKSKPIRKAKITLISMLVILGLFASPTYAAEIVQYQQYAYPAYSGFPACGMYGAQGSHGTRFILETEIYIGSY